MAGEKPLSKPATPDSSKPNRALKFRLDKLDGTHLYLAERGLTPETIQEFDLGFCSKGMMADRIAIPISDPEGNVFS